ncbi:MAG: ATP-dependent zinc metalloprotease FtsH, partial [Anaerolineae bacterium]|nr:ATP-dependent zinc metalloprotease FtsH [Anaerolineae bacterium]
MNPNDSPKDRQFPVISRPIIIALIILAISTYVISFGTNRTEVENVSLPAIVNAIEAGEIETLTVQGDELVATTVEGENLGARKESNISTVEALQIMGVSEEALRTLPIEVKDPNVGFGTIFSILLTFGPILFIGYIFFRIFRQMQGGGGALGLPGRLGRSNPRVVAGATEKDERIERPVITFDDVAGAEQAKLELQEVVEFLKEAEKFIKLGARTPKGVLMAGPPGTGKTLMAKAIAGEAGVPFFSISGSEFVEMFVGVGASRVRDLFKRAREQAPAVIFVDEIDAVGRRRGVGMGGGNDEREQTLNQILVEMDGFDTDTNVIVVAATNRPDVLDPALLRPGRFDRKVILDRPDVNGREAILKIHAKGKPLYSDVNLEDLAKLTPGFVGADLENLVNEAAILAARRNRTFISMAEFQDAMERIIAGPERKGKFISDQEREVIAYHEAGHAVVMHNLPNSDPVHKVSIVSRGMALGYTMPLPENDKYLRTKAAFEDEIVGLLGGRAAEEIIFSEVTTGASNDLERATKLAKAMVTRFGFSDKLGLRTFGEEQSNPYLGSMGETRDYSDEMAQSIDLEIRHILDAAYQKAKCIVTEQKDKLEA